MIIFGGSCEQCDFNNSCSHQKLLWDGEQYKLLPAICRATNGDVYYHKGYENVPAEPLDWFLWATVRNKGWVIYGRDQFIRADVTRDYTDNTSSKVVKPKEKEDTPAPKAIVLGPLKSVYADTAQLQGELF